MNNPIQNVATGLTGGRPAPRGIRKPFPLGAPRALIAPLETILELAEKVIAATGSRSKIVREPLPADDPIQRQPDISLARQKLDWAPTIELDDGLKKTIDYFDTFCPPPADGRRSQRRSGADAAFRGP